MSSGDFSAMIAVILYALAPAVRYAAHGIAGVPEQILGHLLDADGEEVVADDGHVHADGNQLGGHDGHAPPHVEQPHEPDKHPHTGKPDHVRGIDALARVPQTRKTER